MLLNAIGWSTEDDEKLAKLVEPHSYLYNVQDPSRKNILTREFTWQEIAQQLSKPVEECKKRWRGLRDGYMRSKRLGTMHKNKVGILEKLQFLDGTSLDGSEDSSMTESKMDEIAQEDISTEQQVITDNQEYYEITVVDGPPDSEKSEILPKLEPSLELSSEPPKKISKKNSGRRKTMPAPKNVPPIKILPKPILVNGPKIVKYVEDPKLQEQRSQTIDKLIEKILKENTNEIDVFFRSMATSVKKLHPNLIPKVKMEVCNVVAKYEMQSFDKKINL